MLEYFNVSQNSQCMFHVDGWKKKQLMNIFDVFPITDNIRNYIRWVFNKSVGNEILI